MLRHRGFCGKPRQDHGLGQLRDMRNRLVDHEEFSAQRCFYHDVTVPINEKPAIRFRQVSRNFAELVESGFEVFADFLGENIGIGRDYQILRGSHLCLIRKMSRLTLSRFNAFFVSPG